MSKRDVMAHPASLSKKDITFNIAPKVKWSGSCLPSNPNYVGDLSKGQGFDSPSVHNERHEPFQIPFQEIPKFTGAD